MKKLILLICSFLYICNNFAFADEKDDQIIYAKLMNQILFSLETIKHYENRYVLDKEYDNIINKIDQTKLDETTRRAYVNMLRTLTTLKLQDNEKIFIKQQAEKEKREAIDNSLSNVGTGIGVAAIAFSKQGYRHIISSIVYTGVSAFFSYKNTINSVRNQEIRDLFRLEQKTLNTILDQTNALWATYGDIIKTYNIPKEYKIRKFGDISKALSPLRGDGAKNFLKKVKY